MNITRSRCRCPVCVVHSHEPALTYRLFERLVSQDREFVRTLEALTTLFYDAPEEPLRRGIRRR